MSETARTGLFAVLHAASTLEARVEGRLSEVGLSLPKLAALHHLAQAGDSLPLGQLAERLACVKSNVTQLVDRLEADGLVTRAGDPSDRRSRLAVLTESGKSAYVKGTQIRQQSEREIFGTLSRDEATSLHMLLAKLEQA
jgi:DNA-binding MarR family transcriptional regulator